MSKWISLKDQAPTQPIYYDTYLFYKTAAEGERRIDLIWDESMGFFRDAEYRLYPAVTHWMPQPEEPIMEELDE